MNIFCIKPIMDVYFHYRFLMFKKFILKIQILK